MSIIKAPYNFVPLSDKVYFPDWAGDVSQDIPFADGESGTITFELHNETPLFVRNGYAKGEETEAKSFSSHILDKNGNRHYFIPSTTLKGCFRSVLEVLSFSKMTSYNPDSFGYRTFDKEKGEYGTFIQAMKTAKCGWMYQDSDGRYFIQECPSGIKTISHKELRREFPSFNEGADHQTAQVKQESLSANTLYPTISIEDEEYCVVCTGYMNGKRNEYLFSLFNSEAKGKLVDEKVFKSFESVHKYTPYYNGQDGKGGFLKDRLKKGKKIPVFFTKKPNGDIKSIGLARMFKYPYEADIETLVTNQCQDFKKIDLDLAETMFGSISDKDKMLKGRVTFGNAFLKDDIIITDNDCESVSGVFGRPRASYYPLYLKQDTIGKYKNYSTSDVKIAGRKRYRILESQAEVLPLPKNDNEKTLSSMRPIPARQTFIVSVRFHNLKKVEIGALISALTLNKTPNTFVGIGLGKSFGYGKVGVKIISLSDNLKYSEDVYLQEFEKEMSGFLQTNSTNPTKMVDDKSLNALISIASDTHSREDMEMMDLDGYENSKANDDYSVLKEVERRIAIHINEDEILGKYFSDKIDSYVNQKDWQKAVDCCTNAISKLKGKVSVDEFEQKLKDCQKQLNDYLIEIAKKADQEKAVREIPKVKEKIQYLVSNQLFSDAIKMRDDEISLLNKLDLAEYVSEFSCIEIIIPEKKNDLGVLDDKLPNGQYKNSDFKRIEAAVKLYLSKNKLTSVPESQFAYVKTALKRVYDSLSDKDKKKWQEAWVKKGNPWKTIISWLGEKIAEDLHNNM
ncbi:MAG: TIGR03986 family CRISPR-associated RAMP protein [Bacteroidales bacterium]|nr:TIGR03986 family CRISPR-associated RAMP protein [Bacteroidales bacterium]